MVHNAGINFDIRALGTPSEDIWPGVSRMPYFSETFPVWRAKPIQQLLPNCNDPTAIDLLRVCIQSDLNILFYTRWHSLAYGTRSLIPTRPHSYSSPSVTSHMFLQQMLHYEPTRRISCKQALNHPYFRTIDRSSYSS